VENPRRASEADDNDEEQAKVNKNIVDGEEEPEGDDEGDEVRFYFCIFTLIHYRTTTITIHISTTVMVMVTIREII
jgi:hypothetical protein